MVSSMGNFWIANFTSLEKRQSTGASCAYRQCSPNSCKGSACYKPGVYPSDLQRLAKRTFANPSNIGRYLLNRAQLATSATLVPANAGGYFSPTFCVQQKFKDLPRDKETIIGLRDTELTGCTVLTVVSARAVYMCHLFESLNFPHVRTRPTEGEIKVGFQPVLNLISGSGATPYAAGPALDPTLYNGGAKDNTWAFIMTPRSRADENNAASQEHGPEIAQLTALIRQLIPGVGVINYNYYATNNGYDNLYQGVALWQYDPSYSNKGIPNWRLWFEETNETGIKLGQVVI